MAIHVDYPSLKPKLNFTSTAPDSRWTKEGAETFIPLLQKFYKESNFDRFFQAHKPMYAEAEKRFQILLDKADKEWFSRFYGYKPEGKFYIYLGLQNGGMSYGPKVEYPNGKEEFYAIMSNYQTDSQGMPVYIAKDMLPTIVHEFNHSYINHLILKDSLAIKPYATKLHNQVKKQMQRLYYGHWTISLYESLVRAATIRYEIEHDTSKQSITSNINFEYNMGFYWIEDLVTLMGVYEKNRKVYPTFDTFMPVIKAYLEDLAVNMAYKHKRFEDRIPSIVAVLPFSNGATNVDPSITEMKIIFSRPMTGSSFNFSDIGKEHYPVDKVLGWDETRTQLRIRLKLKPNWNYEMIISGQFFRTNDGFAIDNTMFNFKTSALSY
jgi:hypothetical protein